MSAIPRVPTISIDVDKDTGKPSVGVHVDNPNIDVDIPWYC